MQSIKFDQYLIPITCQKDTSAVASLQWYSFTEYCGVTKAKMDYDEQVIRLECDILY
jgi:hypothetical protein